MLTQAASYFLENKSSSSHCPDINFPHFPKRGRVCITAMKIKRSLVVNSTPGSFIIIFRLHLFTCV